MTAPIDPLGALAAAAGEPDAERWWDDVIEHRGDGLTAFEAVGEAMAAVRSGTVPSAGEERREAHMRKRIRAALKAAGDDDRDGGRDGYVGGLESRSSGSDGRAVGRGDSRSASSQDRRENVVVVVCGAWHVPALDVTAAGATTATADNATLRGLPKVKVAVSWVPWTHERLATASGYGAGVRSPGWYDHVFRHPGADGVARFFVDAARVLRRADMPASPDHLIAATRMADTLATMRGRPRPGLDEVLDAADTVMGGLPLVRRQLVVGSAIGSVPDGAPQVPLARDLAKRQRTARLTPTADEQVIELDLRTTERSSTLAPVAPAQRDRRAVGFAPGRARQQRYVSGNLEPVVAARVVDPRDRVRRIRHHRRTSRHESPRRSGRSRQHPGRDRRCARPGAAGGAARGGRSDRASNSQPVPPTTPMSAS